MLQFEYPLGAGPIPATKNGAGLGSSLAVQRLELLASSTRGPSVLFQLGELRSHSHEAQSILKKDETVTPLPRVGRGVASPVQTPAYTAGARLGGQWLVPAVGEGYREEETSKALLSSLS